MTRRWCDRLYRLVDFLSTGGASMLVRPATDAILPQLTVDAERGDRYVHLRPGVVEKTIDLGEGVCADLDVGGAVVGIEIL